MSREGLQKRGNWQTDSGANAAVAEKNFLKAFKKVFEGTSFQIRSKPNEFDKIYTNIQLDPIVIAEIFTPPKPIKTLSGLGIWSQCKS